MDVISKKKLMDVILKDKISGEKKGGSQLYTTVVAWLVLGNLDVKCNHKRFMTDMARHKNRC
jgi:hypothetical protein